MSASPDTNPTSPEQWMVTEKRSTFYPEHTGLFVDGVLAADYYHSNSGPFIVNVHENGNYRVSRQIVVADEETARRQCRVAAGLPPVPTPLPKWAADVVDPRAAAS